MINKYGITGILLFIMTLLSVGISVGQTNQGPIKCICIDAGHGGRDPGALGLKTYEKHIVLSIALKLGKLIEQTYPDIKIVYIRKKDVFVELKERTRIANNHKADLFISIHANSLDLTVNPRFKYVKGVETYVLGSNSSKQNLEVAMKENSVIHYEDGYNLKYEGFDPSRPESYIMFNMLRNIHLDKSLTLASFIQEEIIKNTRQVNRDVQQGPLWVLKDVAMPSVLVEVGYISNPEEERLMMSSAGQDRIVKGIFKGFQAYKAKIEKKVNAVPVKESPKENIVSVLPENTGPAGPVYAIQVASATSRIKNATNLCPGKKVTELNSAGRYRYYVAQSEDLERVKGYLKDVRTKVKDCFIIAIYKGKVISVADARKLEQK